MVEDNNNTCKFVVGNKDDIWIYEDEYETCICCKNIKFVSRHFVPINYIKKKSNKRQRIKY